MKHFYKYLIGVLAAGLLATSCFDAKDFDFDKLSLDNLNPTLYLPLLSDTIEVDAISEEIQFINGQAYFMFDIDDIEMPTVTDVFEIGDQSIQLSTPAIMPSVSPIPISITVPLEGDPAWSYIFDLDLSASTSTAEVSPDSIVFSTLQLVMNNPSFNTGEVSIELTIPNLIAPNGTPFSRTIDLSSSTPIVLDNYSMRIDHPTAAENQITLNYRLIFNNYAYTGGGIDLGMTLRNPEIKEVYGYFGQFTKAVSETVTTGSFDDIDAEWNLKEAFLIMEVENKLALPIRITLDKITSYPDGGSPITVTKVDSIDIQSPPASRLGIVTITKDTLGGSKLGPVISVLPRRLDVDLHVTTNPAGMAKNAISTVLTNPIKASAKVAVPLKIRNTNLTIRDTITFDMTSVEFTDMGIKLNIQNRFPAGVDLQCYLLKKGTGENLGELFTNHVTVPAANLRDVPGTTDERVVAAAAVYDEFVEVKNESAMHSADKIIVECTIGTGNDPKFACITEDNSIQVKIGARASINIDSVREDF